MENFNMDWCKDSGKDPQWLSQALEQGFVIHPTGNGLVLVYGKDRVKLEQPERYNKSEAAYRMRSSTKMTWEDIAKEIKTSQPNAVTMSKLYAKSHGLPWPIIQGYKLVQQ